jgi:RecA/RadA recombinase
MEFFRQNLGKITTGSASFDFLLGGGLPVSCIVDVYGAAATGKTQFCFQNSITTCQSFREEKLDTIRVVFVDCTGSFRPERIAEISESRSLDSKLSLEKIFAVSVRSVSAQLDVCRRFNEDPTFSNCKLLIVDDVTYNFVSDFSKESQLPTRQRTLSLYSRKLSLLANKRALTVLLSNSIRSRGDLGEGETTGEILSSFSLYRLHFTRNNSKRFAEIVQPSLSRTRGQFEIGPQGIS